MTRIDHLIYACPELQAAINELEDRLGVRAALGGKHARFGTHNALLSLGAATYLEIIAPDPDLPPPSAPRPFGLDTLTHAQLRGWALRCDDIDASIAHARASGYDPGDAFQMERVEPGGQAMSWHLTLNAVQGGLEPFLISWGDTEHPARTAPHGLQLESFEIESPDAAALKSTLRALEVHVDVGPAPQPALVARIRGPYNTLELR